MPPHATAAPASRDSRDHRDAPAAPAGSAAAAMQAPSQQPYRVGNYIIREEIGRGSFATVYRGEKTVSLVYSATWEPC